MSKKQIAKILLSLGIGVVTATTGIAAGCGNGNNGGNTHTHDYKYVQDGEDGHHEECKDGDDKKDTVPHNYGDDNICDDCGYVKSGGENPGGEDKPGVPEDETERAIVPAFSGPAEGPTAGAQNLVYKLDATDKPAAVLEEDWSDGIFHVPAGTALRNRDALEEDGSTKIPEYTRSIQNGKITVNVPSAGKLTFYFSSGSSTIGSAKYKISGPGQDGTEVAVDKAAKVLVKVELDVEEGEYVFEKAGGTIDTYAVELTLGGVEAAPITSLELVSAGTTDYLITQKVDCTIVQLVARDGNGITHAVDLANCKFDTTKYNPNVSGEYEIGVTYYLSSNLDSQTLEFSTKYTVKVYAVDSIALDLIGLSGNTQVTAQQVYLTTDVYAAEKNISVIATCDVNGEKITYKLKSDWYTLTDSVDLTTPGTKQVSVSVDTMYTVGKKEVKASYEIVSAAKKEAENGVVTVTVGKNGEFSSVTQAVQYLKKCAYANNVEKVIEIEAGTYTEKVWIDVANVTLVGKGTNADDTIITYSLVEGDADNLSGALWGLNCATVHITGANFKAYNVAIRNDFDYINNSGNYSGSQAAQGVALTLDADGAVIYNCHLYGNQDTLYFKSGRSYYYKTQIDGNVDFIFGNASGLAFFEECKIVAINRAATEKGTNQNGYVTAAKHEAATKPDYGYIFYKCELTDDGKVADGAMSLGRPWGADATVAYIECSFSKAYSTAAYGDSAVKTHRWEAMSAAVPTAADFKEYGSTGEGAITAAVAGGSVISATEASKYTKANIFGTANGKQTYTTKFNCDAEYAKLRILAGLDDGELPEDTTVTVDFKDDTLPNGNCVAAINEKYGNILTWTGTGSFELAKPQNGIKIGTDTVITLKVAGEVSLVAGYELPASDYEISYKDGKATIKFIAATGQYGTFIGGIIIDTTTIPADGEVEKPNPEVPEVKTYKAGDVIDLKVPKGTLYQGDTGIYNGIEVDATSGKFNGNDNSVQVNAGTVLKIAVAGSVDVDIEFYPGYGSMDNVTVTKQAGYIIITVTENNTYIVCIKIVASTTTNPAESKSWKVTVADGNPNYEGEGLTVEYLSKDGNATSANKDDFKFDGNTATVTLTIEGLKAGQTVTITVYGYTGSTGKDVGLKYTATNATAADDCPEKVIFESTTSKNELGSGTFTFTANADGTVTIVLLRSEGNTTRLSKVEIDVA